ncbi:MAG: hypothetical protein ACRDJN_01970, partial [Chloroflexota bacterium]
MRRAVLTNQRECGHLSRGRSGTALAGVLASRPDGALAASAHWCSSAPPWLGEGASERAQGRG